jgi:hypothetical protein
MKKILVLMALVMAMAANAHGADIYEAEIQSFGNYDMAGKTFYVISANPNVSNNDLEFLDYKDYITQCLILKKAILCENSDSADVCVLFDYGVVDKSYVANTAIPIWGVTGSTSVATTSSYIGRGGAFLSSVTTNSISTGVNGVLNVNKNVEKYRRVINLYAYDNKDRSGDPVMLWKTNIISEGENRDLQKVIPYIVYTAIPYMGKQSNRIVRGAVNSDKVDVYFIKNKYYIADHIYLLQPKKEENGLPINVQSVVINEECCKVNFWANYILGYFSDPKFAYQTYLVCMNEKYPIEAVLMPTKSSRNLLNEKIILDSSDKHFLQFIFPVKLQKGDTFDIISYKNKKETKVYLHFKDIVVE